MIEMKLEELISSVSVCSIWIDSPMSFSDEQLFALLKRISKVKYLAYCLINAESIALGRKLETFQSRFPSYRIVAVGNYSWYSSLSIEIQNSILQRIDQGDIFVKCSFPSKDALKFLMLCSEYLLVSQSQHRKKPINKRSGMKSATRIMYI